MAVSKLNFQDVFHVSRETMIKLERYEQLLVKWNAHINLVSKATVSDLWNRHFADSAQIWKLCHKQRGIWLDFGSGAGFPGLVCAIFAVQDGSALETVLVESDGRKAAFLITVAQELGLRVKVISKRIEDVEKLNAQVVSARAVASLVDLLALAVPQIADSAVLLFPKGNSYESELTEARKTWHIEVEIIKSLTDSGSVILKIEDIKRAN